MSSEFRIGFDQRDTTKLHQYWDEIIKNNKWTEGKFTELFEEKWSNYNQLQSVCFGTWFGAAYTCMKYYKLEGKKVLCPSNTFMATPLVIKHSGADVHFVDCNKHDLCMSYDDFVKKVEKHNPSAVWIVHIGGHIAFDVELISKYCRHRGILLFEDCAHSHGASWNGKKPGEWGDAGVYSFYATKTISTGEGGILVTKDKNLVEYAKEFRNYGKPNFNIPGMNLRINEFNAAIGAVQVDRLDEIVEYKNNYAQKLNKDFDNRVMLPDGMISGYYKYIVFNEFQKSTGKVYDVPCHKIMGHNIILENTDWISKNHWCVPIYYRK